MTVRTGTRAAALFIAWLIAIEVAFATPCPRYEIVEFWPTPDLCDGGLITLIPNGANDHGQFVGRLACGSGLSRAFVFDLAAERSELLPTSTNSRATGINNPGTIVGNTSDHLGLVEVAWFAEDGVVTFVEPPPGLATTAFTSVNDEGLIGGSGSRADGAGRVAFTYDRRSGTFDLFGDKVSDYTSRVGDLTNDGLVVGWFLPPEGGQYPYLYESATGALEFPDGCNEAPIDEALLTTHARSADLFGGFCSSIVFAPPALAAIWSDGTAVALPPAEPGETTVVRQIFDRDVVFGSQAARVVLWDHDRAVFLEDVLAPYQGAETHQVVNIVHIDPAGCIYALAAVAGFGFPAFAVICPAPTVGDFTCDDAVDFRDVLHVITAWGPCRDAPCPSDLNDDGWVDGTELLVVLEHWTP